MANKQKVLNQKDFTLSISIVAAGWAAVCLLRMMAAEPSSIAGCIMFAVIALLLALLPCFYFRKKEAEQQVVKDVFLSSMPKGKDVCLAGTIAAGSIAFSLLFEGQFSIHPMTASEAVLGILQAVLYYGIAWGICDDIFFRGFLLRIVNDSFGKWPALIISTALYTLSSLFFYYHGSFNFILIISVILQGMMLSMAVIQTNSFWTAAAMHALLNAVFHQQLFTVSALSDDTSMFHYQLMNAGDVITGGSYGWEASLLVIIGYATVIFYYFLKSSFELVMEDENNGEKKLVSDVKDNKEEDRKKNQERKDSEKISKQSNKESTDNMSTVMMRLEKQSEIKEGVVPPPVPSVKKDSASKTADAGNTTGASHDSSKKNLELLKMNEEIEQHAEEIKQMEEAEEQKQSDAEFKKQPVITKNTAPEKAEKIKPIEIKGYTGNEKEPSLTPEENMPPLPHSPSKPAPEDSAETKMPPLPGKSRSTDSAKMPPLPGDSATTISSHHTMTPEEVEAARKAAYEKYRTHK